MVTTSTERSRHRVLYDVALELAACRKRLAQVLLEIKHLEEIEVQMRLIQEGKGSNG